VDDWTRNLYETLRPALTSVVLTVAATTVAPPPNVVPQHAVFCEPQYQIVMDSSTGTVDLGACNMTPAASGGQPINHETGEEIDGWGFAHEADVLYDFGIPRTVQRTGHEAMGWQPPRLEFPDQYGLD
jgi:hypothetical protein